MTQTTLTEHSTIVKEQSPPVKIDLAYALIQLGNPLLWSIVDSWLLYFYLPPAGRGIALVPVALYSVVVFATRALNAAAVPPIGYMSDHTRSRWGRRLPFMAASSLPMFIFFVLLWMPPVRGESIWNLVYLAVILALYNVFYSLVMIPYNALLPEVALTDQHRVRMAMWCAGAQLVGMILAGFAGLIIKAQGYVVMALICAGIALPLFYLPILALRERPDRWDTSPQRLGFRQSIAITLRNPAFQALTITGLCFWSATTFTMLIIPYIVTQICRLSEEDTMYFYIPGVLTSLVCYPIVMWLANRVGKWRVAAGSLLASAIVLPSLMLIGDWLPVPLMAQGIAWIVLQAVALSGLTMLTYTFMAEVTDYDAELTGQRREGVFYSAWGLFDQIINGTAAAALPLLLLLGRSHSDPNGPLGVRLAGLAGGLLLLVAFLVFLRYPLRHRSSPGRQSTQAEV
jgi:GPH family glycoside/pentoside/hexuronide:cation symporter